MGKDIKYIHLCLVLIGFLSIDVTGQIKHQCGFDALMKFRKPSGNRSTVNLCTLNGALSPNVFLGYGPGSGNMTSLPEGKINYPVRLIRVVNTNFTGSDWSHAKINETFNAAKEYFSDALNIDFIQQGEILELANNALLSINHDTEAAILDGWEASVFNTTNNPMIIYFTNELLVNNLSLGGISFLPCNDNSGFAHITGNRTIISFINQHAAKETLIHEIGHHFGLFHTFDSTFFGPDNYNASSQNLGDGISDTPGTPIDIQDCLERIFPTEDPCDFEQTEIIPYNPPFPSYCTQLTEANGQKLFDNVMSYTKSQKCGKEFTPLQLKKMQDAILTGGRGDICIKPGKPVVSVQGNTNSVSFGSNITLTAVLNSQNGSNTNNVVNWGILQSQIAYTGNSFTITTGQSGMIQTTGTFTIYAVDVPRYNSLCHSDTTYYFINVVPGQNSNYACFDIVYADYYYVCGAQNLFETTGLMFRYGGRTCTTSTGTNPVTNTSNPGGNTGGSSGTGGTSGPGLPGGTGSGTVSTGSNVPVITKNEECHECVKEIQRKILLIKQGGN